MEPQEYARLLEPLLGQAAGYARALLKCKEDAEDAVQQAAVRGLERIQTYDTSRPFKGWWFAILRNYCIDMLRDSKARMTVPIGDHDPATAQPNDEAEPWERLDAAIADLSADHQEILRLRYFADLSYIELAAALRIPQGTVMSRLHLARKALTIKMTTEEK